ncbi:MAG: 6-phosphogluconolactonase [Planctomycetes bacterium]|nr:6-phosphogluconolactonase [Planctomycetota bacterium]
MAAVEVIGELFVEPTPERVVASSADWILARICIVLTERERCAVALSGGSTPGPVYRRLAEAGASGAFDSSRLDLYLADERCVPADDAESNARLVRESWLAIDAGPTLHTPHGSGDDDPAAAAHSYGVLLPDALDLVVLGIGPDGHTASLFPGTATLAASDRVLFIDDSPKPPPQRWSLSARALRNARTLVTIVTGADKADAVHAALEGDWDPSATPAQLARRGAWFVDAAAASKIQGETR